ncbi:MAG: ribonuclease HII [Deferribacteres bacterium]|nr:ribonuclease HII [Deferribacteres bacterium]
MNPKVAFDLKLSQGKRLVCGIDEAGRGCLAGPVVAAAVVVDYSVMPDFDVDDSKKLSPSERKRLFNKISSSCHWAVFAASWKRIDEINIRNAAIWAMIKAYSCLKIRPDVVLIDGNMKLSVSDITYNIIRGDARSFAIGAASIVAKVVRDRLMERYHLIFPEYNFSQNKGYPTRYHRRMLQEVGPSPIHRRSFRGVGFKEEKR